MTPEAQNIAIAEACGWKDCAVDTLQVYCDDATEPGFVEQKPLRGTKDGQRFKLPDYLNDLNAIAEAEKALFSLGKQKHFVKAMWEVCGTQEDRWNMAGLISATAAQRSKAFLKAIGKWVAAPTSE